jgi:Calcineurin-like phosphoesterase
MVAVRGARNPRAAATATIGLVVTAIVSDLHLGLGSGADLLRREGFRARLIEAIAGADRVVLLGDVLELRDRPLPEVLGVAGPVLAEIAAAIPGGELVIVPGNHDHHLIEPWLERRRLSGAPALELEQTGEPEGLAFEALCERIGFASVRFAYPGLRIRADVYAIHGHYLDRHLTVPTIERLGVAAIERVLGIPASGPDPLLPPEEHRPAEIDEYERVQTPVYALLFGLAQATTGEGRGGADPSMRLWQMIGGGESRSARLRGWLVGTVAVPGAVGVANRLGLGPVRSDLSAGAIGRAGIEAMGEVVEELGIDADHVIHGHTHRRGGPELRPKPASGGNGVKLWNTGSWVHSPGLLGASAAVSPYWPGTICIVGGEGEPELRHLLDELDPGELAGDGD